MTSKMLSPDTIRRPFARYAHGVEIPANARMVVTSGQLGIGPDEFIPDGAAEQAALCFGNIDAILAEAGMSAVDVVRINAFVSDRAHMAGYMAARDRWLSEVAEDALPASTLVIVNGFTRPEFLVEVEVTAARA
ncbi:MAG: enamine deaminase RidA [Confluentimicrobium sp.]|nr:enamine deaminase RidA [Actibacterium sp.]